MSSRAQKLPQVAVNPHVRAPLVSSVSPTIATNHQLEKLGLKAQFVEQLSRLPTENAATFFERLLRRLEQVSSLEAKDRWLAYLGLRAMHTEAKQSRYDRDVVMLQRTWSMLEPLLREHGLLLEYDSDADLREMIDRFLSNQAPVLESKAKRLATKRKRNRLRLPSVAQMERAARGIESSPQAVQIELPLVASHC